MKKVKSAAFKTISFVMVLAMIISVLTVMTAVPFSAGKITDKTDSALQKELIEFINTARGQLPRDDYENIPGATKHPLTEQL